MDYGFADCTVEYVDAKAIRSFLGVKGRTSLFPSEMRETRSFPILPPTAQSWSANMGSTDYGWRHGSNVLNVVSQKSRGCGTNPGGFPAS
jgi:hypothetical protein